jgi:hypothetical protein
VVPEASELPAEERKGVDADFETDSLPMSVHRREDVPQECFAASFDPP